MRLFILITLVLGIILFAIIRRPYYKGPVSDHFDGKRFFNPGKGEKPGFPDVLKWRLESDFEPWPDSVPITQLDSPPQKVPGDQLRVSYVGHATFLIQTQGLNILTDPVWSQRVSPVTWAGPKRVTEPGIPFDKLPPIDIVLVSHSHYDHMDADTLDRLQQTHKPRFLSFLGNDTLIKRFNSDIKTDTFDWGQSTEIAPGITIHFEPAHHWSSRSPFDQNKALWGAFVIQTPAGNIYFAGDTGFGGGDHFRQTAQRFNTFRLALIPIGAYMPKWFMGYSHMDPEEALRAHQILGSPPAIGMHFDTFSLTDTPYGQALKDLEKAKGKLNSGDNFQTLKAGQFVTISN